MSLTPDQELRRDLLLFSLGKQTDLEAAMEMAARMEHFVLEGRRPAPEGRRGTADVRQAAAPRAEEAAGSVQAATTHAASPCHPGDAEAAAGGPGSGGQKRRWSEADDTRLQELWASDLSLEEIAAHLDRTVPSLYSRARAQGLPRRSPKLPEISAPETPAAEIPAPESKAVESAESEAKDLAKDLKDRNDSVAVAPAVVETQPDVVPSGLRAVREAAARRSDFAKDRFRTARSAPKTRPGKTARPGEGVKTAGGSGIANERFTDRTTVDPVIQFLRSRDYSVVRVGEGRFQLDGRRILSADELREKANDVRKALGQSSSLRFQSKEAG